MVKIKIPKDIFNGLYNRSMARFVCDKSGGHVVVLLIHPN